jgi:hypothetical protein
MRSQNFHFQTNINPTEEQWEETSQCSVSNEGLISTADEILWVSYMPVAIQKGKHAIHSNYLWQHFKSEINIG